MTRVIIFILCLWSGVALAQSIGGNFGMLQGRVVSGGGGGGGGGGGPCAGAADFSDGCAIAIFGH